MTPDGHVHIISAGESIQTAFPALLRTLPEINRVYIIADGEDSAISRNPETERLRAQTRSAVEAVKAICGPLAIPCSRELVFDPLLPSARALLARIRRENRRARFTFDLSGGTKRLCMALFALAPWTGGEAFASFDGRVPKPLPVPGRDIRMMLENVNYQTILAVLLRNRPLPTGLSVPFTPRDYLFSQVWPYYVRQRAKKPEPGRPAPQYRSGRKPANDLSQATFSWFMKTLTAAGLVEEAPDPKNRKETAYRITENGETAFRFFADPAANSTVKMVLDGA